MKHHSVMQIHNLFHTIFKHYDYELRQHNSDSQM